MERSGHQLVSVSVPVGSVCLSGACACRERVPVRSVCLSGATERRNVLSGLKGTAWQ